MSSGGLSFFFFFKQKTAYEMRISDWSSDVCSSDLLRASPEGCKGLPWLWGGVVAGLGLAVLLALVLLGVSSWLSSTGQEWFQAGMGLAACALVVQMVYWMRRHGRTLKKELETGATRELADSNWWGLLALVMIAVAREGSATVVFLYGSVADGADSGFGWRLGLAGVLGFLAGLASFWVLQLGGRLITWRRFLDRKSTRLNSSH